MNNADFKDTRILEAFDYIDPKYIAEVAESLKLKSVRTKISGTEPRRTPFKHWRQFAAMAACLLLLMFAFPVFSKVADVISSFAAGWGSGMTEDCSDILESTNCEDEYLYGDYLTPIDGLEPLTKSILNEINTVYSRKYSGASDDFISIDVLNHYRHGIHYLGDFNGKIVLWQMNASDASKSFCVAGYDFFLSGSGFNIDVYYNRECMSLIDAYETGVMTQDEIRTVYCRQMEYDAYFSGEVWNIEQCKVPIAEEDLININNAWSKRFGEGVKYADSLDEVLSGRPETYCYGKFGDKIVFRAMEQSLEYVEVWETVIEIGGYSITVYYPSKGIWVYYQSKLYSLEEAYQYGYLTVEDIAAIAQRNIYSYY